MSDDNTADWNSIVGNDGAAGASGASGATATAGASGAAGAKATQNLPPFPQGFGYMVGRLPISGNAGRAVVQLPEPIKGVSCAFTVANVTVLSDCYRSGNRKCTPNVVGSRPLNDREIEVELDGGGDEVARGLGWTLGSQYPGAQPETRSVETGQPAVEVLLIIGPKCGCDAENWASDDEWGQ